jgi:hypothetical protein
MADVFDQVTHYSAVIGAVAMMTVLAVVLRWGVGTSHDQPSPYIPDPNDVTGFGLLEEVSTVPTQALADALRTRLVASGIRATVAAVDAGGFRLLVFRHDMVDAKLVLSEGPPQSR